MAAGPPTEHQCAPRFPEFPFSGFVAGPSQDFFFFNFFHIFFLDFLPIFLWISFQLFLGFSSATYLDFLPIVSGFPEDDLTNV